VLSNWHSCKLGTMVYMGDKDKEADKKPEEEDPPIVVELKKLDDQYLEIEREFEKEMMVLKNKYLEKQAPLLEERFKVLQGTEETKTTGTPACRGFWLMAMQNHPAFDEMIEEYDCSVLEYLTDIKVSYLDLEDHPKGFKLEFHFAENPYFEHKVLEKSYFTKEESPYTGNIEATEIKATKIEWKSGKDVTVEKVKDKKGKRNAKAKNKEKTEARPSFFRSFFRSLKEGDPLPEGIDSEELKQLCEDSDEAQQSVTTSSHGQSGGTQARHAQTMTWTMMTMTTMTTTLMMIVTRTMTMTRMSHLLLQRRRETRPLSRKTKEKNLRERMKKKRSASSNSV